MMENGNVPAWRKSSRCGNATCVEVAKVDDQYLIRDSKNPDGPVLRCTRERWASFIAGLRGDEFQSVVV